MSQRKVHDTNMCAQTQLLTANVAGAVLTFFGAQYTLCPQCACVMQLTKDRYMVDAFRCVQCTYMGRQRAVQGDAREVRCFHCCTMDRDMKRVCIDHATLAVCKSCHKNWMDEDVARHLRREDAHAAVNERWGRQQVRETAHQRAANGQ